MPKGLEIRGYAIDSLDAQQQEMLDQSGLVSKSIAEAGDRAYFVLGKTPTDEDVSVDIGDVKRLKDMTYVTVELCDILKEAASLGTHVGKGAKVTLTERAGGS